MTTNAVIDKKIPDRWRGYKPCGIPIRGERIIAFKTPLSHQYDNRSDHDNGIKENERFTPEDLLKHMNQKCINLGMVVDFTNTNRYYNGREFSKNGIRHCKIKCVGKEIPNEDVVSRFKTEVCTFVDKEKRTDVLIGVHCTHGLNRTGYVVCRYLIECKGYTPEEAIVAFNLARGHDIEHVTYLEDLRKRSPKFDVASFVRNGDKSRGREIPPDKPRYVNSDYVGSHYHRGVPYQSTGNSTQSRRKFTHTQHRDNNYDNYDRNYHYPENYYRYYSEYNRNDYGYSHSSNYRNYGPGRNREESYRRENVNSYSQQRTKRY